MQWDRTYSEKDQLEFERLASAAVKRKQPVPEFVKPRPELRFDLAFYYTAYIELSQAGFGEVRDYAQHYGIPFEQLRYVLRVMRSNDRPLEGK